MKNKLSIPLISFLTADNPPVNITSQSNVTELILNRKWNRIKSNNLFKLLRIASKKDIHACRRSNIYYNVFIMR